MENGPKACNAPTIQESEFQEATIKAINQLISCYSSVKQMLAENITVAIADDNSDELDGINTVLKAKQKELVKLAHAKKGL